MLNKIIFIVLVIVIVIQILTNLNVIKDGSTSTISIPSSTILKVLKLFTKCIAVTVNALVHVCLDVFRHQQCFTELLIKHYLSSTVSDCVMHFIKFAPPFYM